MKLSGIFGFIRKIRLLGKPSAPVIRTDHTKGWGTVPMTDKELREWSLQMLARSPDRARFSSFGIDPVVIEQAQLSVHALAQVRRWSGIPRPDVEEHRPKWSDAKEVRIDVLGRSYRVFPHQTDDGFLALRVLWNKNSYVKLADGRFRFKPDNFVMPAYLPDDVKISIEEDFILTGDDLTEACALFDAYESGAFTAAE